MTTNTMNNTQTTTQNTELLGTTKAGMTTGSRKSLGTSEGSLGTYSESTQKGNDEILEQSPVQAGETRRSSVQIRTAPPKTTHRVNDGTMNEGKCLD